MRYLLMCCLGSLCFNTIFCTTFAAPPNLKALGMQSQVVVLAKCIQQNTIDSGHETNFRFQFDTKHILKGKIKDQFQIQNLHKIVNGFERTITGDVYFEEDQTYLLFLNSIEDNIWKATMLSYGIYEEAFKGTQSLMIPMSDHLHIINQSEVEPLHVYYKEKLITMLKGSLRQNIEWNAKYAKSDYVPSNFLRAKPDHCNFLSGAPYAIWSDFPTAALPIWYHASGDLGCGNAGNQISNSIQTLNNAYSGINLTAAGTHGFDPPNNCSPTNGGANGNTFTSYINNNYGSSRNLLIQFNDPCNEMDDLSSNCSGILAYGGIYWSGDTHQQNGSTWRHAAYGFVVTNNDFGSCYCGSSTYQNTMTHEIGHALGFNHITSGAANLNPSNAPAITSLDIECLDYAYPPSSNPNCNQNETISNETYSSNMTIMAISQINLNNININSGVLLTLIAPSINLPASITMSESAQLIIINENQCN